MNKNVKTAIVVVGVALAAFMLLSWTKKPSEQMAEPVIKDEEKEGLFSAATNYYRGGIQPSKFLLDELEKSRNEALAKIKAMALEAEFEAWKKQKQAEAEERERLYGPEALLPSTPTPNF